MTIEEIRKNAPDGATHYWHENKSYFKIDAENRNIFVWVGGFYNQWMTPKIKLKMNKLKPLN